MCKTKIFFTGISNKCTSTSSTEQEVQTTLIAPVHTQEPEPLEVDISNLTADDLQAMKEHDAFLYYSIPSVRRAQTLRLQDVDMSRLEQEDDLSMIQRQRRSSCSSSRIELTPSKTTVKRQTRVSFECHTDLLMEDLLGEFEEQFSEEDAKKIEMNFSNMFGLGDLYK